MGLDDDAKVLIADSLKAGYFIFSPSSPIEINGTKDVAWWRIDPRTGTTLGIADTGAGQSTAEYGINVTVQSVDMLVRIVSFGRCLQQFLGVFPGGDRKQALKTAMCVFGHIIGMRARNEMDVCI